MATWNQKELKKFELTHRDMVHEYSALTTSAESGFLSCEFNFVNLFCWSDLYDYSWFIHEERLVVSDGKDGILFMPLGRPMPADALVRLSQRAVGLGLSPDICLVPGAYPEQFPEIEDFYRIERDRDAGEYIYTVQGLADLKGAKLHKKKNLISQFTRRYPEHRTEPMGLGNLPELKKFTRDLLNIMDPVPDSLKEEFCAMERALDHWADLNLEGLIAWVGDKVAAFAVFSPLGKDTYTVHFEKSNIAFKGAAQFINRETAAWLEGKARYLNREQDLGIKGLRQAKLSYDPHRVWVPLILKYMG